MDSNSQNGSSLKGVKVHALTLFCTHGNTKCDSRASFLARNLASLCFGREPKARVTTWNTFGAQTSHEQTQTQKTHHGPNLGETTTFPLVVFSMFGHGASTQMSFCFRTPKLGILKFPKLGLPQL